MLPLLGAELRRITGRRGSFYGSILFALIIMGITIAVDDAQSGATAMERVATAGRYAGLLGVVVMGALAGSYDSANGTMRYLVLTGVPRWQLAVVRIVGMMVAVLPMALLILVIAYVSSMGVGDGPSGTVVGESTWAVLATLWTWGIVSTSVGMLMRSNGSAIAVSVVLFFGGALITALVAEFISETLANYLLPTVFEQVAALIKPDEEEGLALSLAAAFAVLAVWLVALSAAAIARVQRDEY
ncbi:ABC transporter permease [Patulibacter americanus]|uniref:ABC transporter permease n=1 Tax=Patulibacter americanus TaxID=588672 RepID=UPI0003B569A8|nr:ABC transporter permease [Patulibacter americanus]